MLVAGLAPIMLQLRLMCMPGLRGTHLISEVMALLGREIMAAGERLRHSAPHAPNIPLGCMGAHRALFEK